MHPRVADLADGLSVNFSGRAWHGATLLGSLRGVSAKEAGASPPGGGHSIWELVLHAAYWKYAVRRQLAPHTEADFPRSPSNWPRMPKERSEKAWKADVALLKREHGRLLEAVEGLRAEELDRVPPKGKKWTRAQLAGGVSAHDVYHTGQIQAVKRAVRGKE
jgi:uncharacterized damage-inducible protein DinB